MVKNAQVKVNKLENCHSRMLANYERHMDFEILWFFDDCEGVQFVDHQKQTIIPNSFTLLSKSQTHSIQGKLNGISVTMSLDFFTNGDHVNLRVLFNPFANDPISLTKEQSDELKPLIKLLLAEMRGTNHLPIVQAYVVALVHKISLFRSYIDLESPSSRPIELLYEHIESNYRKERKAEFYAEKVGLTPKRLNQILKAKTGLTLTQLIHRILTAESKRMLAKDDKTIKEVAFELNFSEQAYFSRFFKKNTGMTPEEFVKSTRENNNS